MESEFSFSEQEEIAELNLHEGKDFGHFVLRMRNQALQKALEEAEL
jgi:hypothetical protein